MKLTSAVSALAMLAAGTAFADCDTVVMSDVGWTDITTTTATARHVLEGLGYKVDVKVLSVPVTFASLDSDDVDVFLGNWMPAQAGAIGPYLESGEIEDINVNLEGTKYTLATPTYAWEAGLKSYADIAKFADELDNKIYGIEPGNEGNAYLVSLTEENAFGLGDFKIVESSEQGMLAQVARFYRKEEPVVFLGWEPHPMNANFDLKYLPGGEDFFGGEGVVHTVTRKGYSAECPNLGTLFANMDFSLDMENKIMGEILDDGADPAEATEAWLKENPQVLDTWLAGVTTRDGGDGLAAVRQSLGL
ncbi:glycine/betaine ABC transporter substrate-binding protein [Rhodovulum sulfidophilum]|uniref:Choline ABC transporter substrate-binding protein n=1 Tax=Rhodovulum visakhapatnamense TaxID=364297 RepID=A0ABS1RBZ4_9RHOB|nr:choline ABC transporter substrate-binding protein [Rhodovulum visakhapatnamense]MBL3568098.1 choline ABC transporter substrate-binding protein [Rhodovulum visakhapatnamense]MBL3577166.1 choline ABC transporter substrate-binding protein [Rhodovulum visakhapatnamense]OLS45684.1 glycine/betaine ABC transporter substrate-binding protein [Rhodovulum sulfidophilum]